MRSSLRNFQILAAALLAFGTAMAFESTDANAVVCARGVHRAGYPGAVVVRRPLTAPACHSALVNGAYVRRCR
jgi:hypothetical protein